MNAKLLRKVKRHILAEPKRLYMGDYVRSKARGDGLPHAYPRCGTAACIAGWTCILSIKDKTPVEINSSIHEHDEARHLLGLTDKQADALFFDGQWPDQFLAGANDDGKASTARMAAKRIEHFIKTKGRE